MLLLIAADAREYAGFSSLVRQSSRDVRWLATTTIRGSDAILVANGIGRCAAAAGTRKMLAKNCVHAVISTGFAGALDRALQIGDVVLAQNVLDGDRVYCADTPLDCPADVCRGSVVTVDEVVRSPKIKLALARLGARAVDMESAAVAAVAAEHRLPFYCIRAISDSAEQHVPVDFGRALRRDGTISLWSVLEQVGFRAANWFALVRLWRDSRIAADSLARNLSGFDFRP